MPYTIYKKGFLLNTSKQMKSALVDTVMVVENASFWLFTRLLRSQNESTLFLVDDICGQSGSFSIHAHPFITSQRGVFTQRGTLALLQKELPYGHVLPASCSVDLIDREVLDANAEFFKVVKVVTLLVAVIYFAGSELKQEVTFSII